MFLNILTHEVRKINTRNGGKICLNVVFAKKKYEGYGNNAMPVNKGRCCDECNISIVVPTRIANYRVEKEIVNGSKIV